MDVFSGDYATARQRFHEASDCAGFERTELQLLRRSPTDDPLCITIVRLGATAPRHLVIHVAGTHGVEGFVGSAIQLDVLRRPLDLPPESALALVHVLNPYGMSRLRRTNGDNVDLNRNLLAAGDAYRGCPAAYDSVSHFLNPARRGSRASFLLSAASAVTRHGLRPLKQAIAGGQYKYPQGLFFGGHQRAEELDLFLEWCRAATRSVPSVAAIDVHSGLGRFGQESLLTSHTDDSEPFARLRQRCGDRVSSLQPSGVAYEVRGSVLAGLPAMVYGPHWLCVGQEFGTYSALRVLRALRDENWLHFYGAEAREAESIRQRFRDVFCPKDRTWRERIVSRGRALIEQLLTAD